MNNFLEEIRLHFGRTLIYILTLLCGMTIFFAFSHDTQMRIGILAFVTIAYIIWGLAHHYVQKDLTLVKAFEYITIAVFAAVGIGAVLGWSFQ